MSFLVSQDSECPFCKLPNEAELWSIINVKDDPELKDIMLGGELNMIECHSCHEIYYVEHFLIYHDPEQELMAFVYPDSYRAEREKWEAKTREDFAQSQSTLDPAEQLKYQPSTFFGLDELVKLAEWAEEVSIQGEIVSLLSEQHHFPVKKLKPAEARGKNLPIVLPYADEKGLPGREAVLKGLDHLKTINDRLFVYEKTKQHLIDHPELALEL